MPKSFDRCHRPAQFFAFQKRVTAPDAQLAPAVRRWTDAYQKFGLLDRISSLTGKLPEVSPTTTLAEVEALKTAFPLLADILKEFDKEVGDVALDDAVRPRAVLDPYLKQLATNLSRLQTAATKQDTAAMKDARDAAAATPSPKEGVAARVQMLVQRLGK